MQHAQTSMTFKAPRRGFHDITQAIIEWVIEQNFEIGLLTVFCRHTSASLTIQENADPDVLHDLECFLEKQAPEEPQLYRHSTEGPDDMPAHIKSMLTEASLSIPVSSGRLALGTWQGIYLIEHRSRPQSRQIVLHLHGM